MKRIRQTLTPAQDDQQRQLARNLEAGDRQQVAQAVRQLRQEAARLQQVLRLLAQERQAQDMSLSELARRSGIDKGNLARLESGAVPNPTLATIARIADALGKDIRITLHDKPAA